MGARGPKPFGSVKLSARLSAGLVKALMASAAKRKKNMSQEIENRLSQALREDSDDRTRGLVLLPTSVLRSTMGRKPMPARIEDLKAPAPAPSTNAPHWLDDRAAFDQAVIAINTVLAAIRPPGEAPTDDLPFRGRFNALATLQDLVKAPVMAPASASKHVRSMVHIRDAIGGDVVDRALTFGRTA
jgi:hypothetical protein